jgi:tetratricopeptide (TPR) repeat protein
MVNTNSRRGNVNRVFKLTALSLCLLVFSACPSMEKLYQQAYSHYIWRNEKKALEILDQIIAQDAHFTKAYVLEALIFEAQGDLGKAQETLGAAKEKSPPSAVVCYNLGNLHFKQKEYKNAIDEYSQAVVIDPGLKEAFLNRANSHMALKEYKLALKDYRDFLSKTDGQRPEVEALVRLLEADFAGN